MTAQWRLRNGHVAALTAVVLIPWWVGATWLAWQAWRALTALFGGPWHAALAVAAAATCGWITAAHITARRLT